MLKHPVYVDLKTSGLSRFIPLSDGCIYSRPYARRIPLVLFPSSSFTQTIPFPLSLSLSFSLSAFSFFYRSSKPNHPVSATLAKPVAHYRNVSVTAFKNVNLPYSRHCPVDAKCSLAGIPIVDFGG